jgi:hypothetical protein
VARDLERLTEEVASEEGVDLDVVPSQGASQNALEVFRRASIHVGITRLDVVSYLNIYARGNEEARRVVWVGSIVVVARPASAEWFLDAYGGVSITADADVTVRNGPTFDDKVKFDTEGMGGARLGYWLEGFRWMGVAGDVPYFAPAGQGTAAEARFALVPGGVERSLRRAPGGAIGPGSGWCGAEGGRAAHLADRSPRLHGTPRRGRAPSGRSAPSRRGRRRRAWGPSATSWTMTGSDW